MKHVVLARNSSANHASTSDHEETSKDPDKSETESKEMKEMKPYPKQPSTADKKENERE